MAGSLTTNQPYQGPYLGPGGAVPPGLRSVGGGGTAPIPGIIIPPPNPISGGSTPATLVGSASLGMGDGPGRVGKLTARLTLSARGWMLPGITSEPTMVDGS